MRPYIHSKRWCLVIDGTVKIDRSPKRTGRNPSAGGQSKPTSHRNHGGRVLWLVLEPVNLNEDPEYGPQSGFFYAGKLGKSCSEDQGFR